MRDKKFFKKFIWLFPFAAAALLTGGECELFDFFDDDDDDRVISQVIPLFTGHTG